MGALDVAPSISEVTVRHRSARSALPDFERVYRENVAVVTSFFARRLGDPHTVAARFNKRVALTITKHVGSMTCFWVFCLLSLCSLPSVLSGFEVFRGAFPVWMVEVSIIALVSWIAQTFLQLVLLPSIMVGQNLQNEAADARSAKTFEDVEVVLDRLYCDTQGGLRVILDAIEELKTRAP